MDNPHHLAHWYPTAAYLYILGLDALALAWEYLRLRCKMDSTHEVMVKLSLHHSDVPTPGHTVYLHAPPQHMRVYL